MSVTLFHYNTFDLKELIIHKLIQRDNLLLCDLSVNQQPLMFFIDQLSVVKFTEEEILLSLKNDTKYKKLFDDLDAYIISYIQEQDITKRYNLKKFDYVSFINTYTNLQGETYDVIKFKLNLSGTPEFKTNLFYKYGSPVEDLNVMKGDVLVRTVIECMNITFDLVNKNIYIDNCVRQLKVKLLHPKRIDNNNLPYSFIDSDNNDKNKNLNVEENKDKKEEESDNNIEESDNGIEVSDNGIEESDNNIEESDNNIEESDNNIESSDSSDTEKENNDSDSDIAKLFMDDNPAILELDNSNNSNTSYDDYDDYDD
jgi:hypothetical protein